MEGIPLPFVRDLSLDKDILVDLVRKHSNAHIRKFIVVKRSCLMNVRIAVPGIDVRDVPRATSSLFRTSSHIFCNGFQVRLAKTRDKVTNRAHRQPGGGSLIEFRDASNRPTVRGSISI